MKNRFKFRAKSIIDYSVRGYPSVKIGTWVYGNYYREVEEINDGFSFDYCNFIKEEYGDHYRDIKIDIKTLGQCTGLKDKTGKLIYDGDILQYQNPEACNGYYPVEPNDPLRGDKNLSLDTEWQDMKDKYKFTNVEIMGNIYDNKELLTMNRKEK